MGVRMRNDGRSEKDQTINAVLHALENDRRQSSDRKERTLSLVLDRYDQLTSDRSQTQAELIDFTEDERQPPGQRFLWPRVAAAAAVILLIVAVLQVRGSGNVVTTTDPSVPVSETTPATDPPVSEIVQGPASLLPELPDGIVIFEESESHVSLVAEGDAEDPEAVITLIDVGGVDIDSEIEALLDRNELSGFRSPSSVQDRIFSRWELSVSGLIDNEETCYTDQPCVAIGNGLTIWIGNKDVVHVLTTDSGRNLVWLEHPMGALGSIARQILNQINLD
jgi:hypothetical protein